MGTACVTCAQEADPDTAPLWQRIAGDELWRVSHAFATSMPGWLVLVPRRHVIAVAELTDAESAGLGVWQVRLSRALHAVTGCVKTYIAQFAGAEGFSHVHFHVVPRMAELPPDLRGPRVFGLIGNEARACVDPAEMDALARNLRDHLRPPAPR